MTFLGVIEWNTQKTIDFHSPLGDSETTRSRDSWFGRFGGKKPIIVGEQFEFEQVERETSVLERKEVVGDERTTGRDSGGGVSEGVVYAEVGVGLQAMGVALCELLRVRLVLVGDTEEHGEAGTGEAHRRVRWLNKKEAIQTLSLSLSLSFYFAPSLSDFVVRSV